MNSEEQKFLDGVLANASEDLMSNKIKILQDVQDKYGYLKGEHLEYLAKRIETSYSDLYGVATFYAQFKLNKPGKKIIRVCRGTACHVRGGARVLKEVERILGIKRNETTKDGEYTLETVACVGACALAPTVVLGEEVHRRMNPKKVAELLSDRKAPIKVEPKKEETQKPAKVPIVKVRMQISQNDLKEAAKKAAAAKRAVKKAVKKITKKTLAKKIAKPKKAAKKAKTAVKKAVKKIAKKAAEKVSVKKAPAKKIARKVKIIKKAAKKLKAAKPKKGTKPRRR